MNQCNYPDHGAINAERAEARGLRKAWVELDDKRQILEKQLATVTKERDKARERADTMFAKHADILDQARQERDEAREQRDRLETILKDCLYEMPVGYIPNHTVENLPLMIKSQARMLAEEITHSEKLEEQRDRLAEALRMITTFDYTDLQCDNGHGARSVATEALQSLTTNAEAIEDIERKLNDFCS